MVNRNVNENTQTTGLDIGDIFKTQNVSVDIKHPKTGDPVGLKIELRSPHSREYRAAGASVTRRFEKLALRNKQFSAEERDENDISLLVAATVGWHWSNGLTFHGNSEPVCDEANVARFYRENVAVRKQVEDVLNEEDRFFQK